MLEIFGIVLDMGLLYVVPVIFLFLCPGFYWDEIYLTSVPIQAILQAHFGINIPVWTLRIFLIIMHNNFVISLMFHAVFLGVSLLGLAGGGYYGLHQKLL